MVVAWPWGKGKGKGVRKDDGGVGKREMDGGPRVRNKPRLARQWRESAIPKVN